MQIVKSIKNEKEEQKEEKNDINSLINKEEFSIIQEKSEFC